MKYNTQYFIEKFDAIPDSKWTTGTYKSGSKRCALGHCGWSVGERTAEGAMLNYKLIFSAAGINDGYILNMPISGRFIDLKAKDLGKSPKERILNALALVAAIETYGF